VNNLCALLVLAVILRPVLRGEADFSVVTNILLKEHAIWHSFLEAA